MLDGLILGIVAGWFRGGRLARLPAISVRHTWLLLSALTVQVIGIALIEHGWLPGSVLVGCQVLSHGLLIAGLAINWHLPGTGMVAAGVVLNGLAIAVSGGRMPVWEPALRLAGLEAYRNALASGTLGKHVLAETWGPLQILGDFIPLQPPYYPVRQVVSPGDLVQVLGMARLVCRAMGSHGSNSVGVHGETVSAKEVNH